jgi:predicted alpha/beta hydrolase
MQNELRVKISCRDGVVLGGHLWPSKAKHANQVIINPATGVAARYYHRYAHFLASHGFDVLTYDYRGIGMSRPQDLKGCGYRWRDWGEQDFDAAIGFMRERNSGGALIVVGHSIGGFLPGLAPSSALVDRMLTIGAQYAWLGDYAPRRRLALILKWHVAMPIATAFYGYFPGRRFGWLEDLPAGVANEWSFRRSRFELSHASRERQEVLSRISAMKSPILAIAVSDDELGTLPAIRRTLAYYTNSPRTAVLLQPSYYDRASIGHFNLFRDEHATGFWADSLQWLGYGNNPWPKAVVEISSEPTQSP